MQSSVEKVDPSRIITAYSGVYIARTDQYATVMTHFPGTNATGGPWSTRGRFKASIDLFVHGEKVVEIFSNETNQDGIVKLDIDDYFGLYPEDSCAFGILKYEHPADVPVAGYFSLVHKKTGSYAPVSVLQFIGDEVFTEWHSRVLETALFWPGLASHRDLLETIIIMNPYTSSFLFQLHLYVNGSEKSQSQVMKIQPKCVQEFVIEDLFKNEWADVLDAKGGASLCVSAQYKVLTLMKLTQKNTGIITGIDHLHPYGLIG